MTRSIGFTFALVAALAWSGWTISGRPSSSQSARAGQAQAVGQDAANLSGVTRQQFDQWMTQLANWGRWGKEDERGALNLITPEKRRQAAMLAKTGTTVSLAQPIAKEPSVAGAQPRPVNRAGASASVFLIDGDYLFERQEIEYHGGRLSHFDALCHVSYNGKLYNGLNFREVVTEDGGCAKLAVTSAQDGIVTRGLLLDMPGTRVTPKDIEAWEKRTGIRIAAGDALLLRSQATRRGRRGPRRCRIRAVGHSLAEAAGHRAAR